MSTPLCDHRVVGVLITNPDHEYLMFTRNTPPAGIAPPAGHVDDHGTPVDAAIAETREEVGLTVTNLHLVMNGYLPNACRRDPGDQDHGHWWEIFAAETTGTLNPNPREARDPSWVSPGDVAHLAERTVARLQRTLGRLRGFPGEPAPDLPGLEPVWAHWFDALDVIRLDVADLKLLERAYRRQETAAAPAGEGIGGSAP